MSYRLRLASSTRRVKRTHRHFYSLLRPICIVATVGRFFSTSSSSSDSGAAFTTGSSSSAPNSSSTSTLTAEDDAQFEEVLARMQAAAANGDKSAAPPNLEQLMEQMKAMGMDPSAGGAAKPPAEEKDLEGAYAVKAKGEAKTMSFQTETRQILDIVANSLYTDHEVFIRELISNASDALEKLRFLRTQGASGEADTIQTHPLGIQIQANEAQNLLVIQDNGIGMTAEELQSHLGVIARSGSKAFMKDLAAKGMGNKETGNIIGQFGVGFYSAFMVSDKVEVISQSSKKDPATGKPYPAHLWTSDGLGTYTLQEIESTGETGTTIKMYLKPKYKEFASQHTISTVVQKYSNFVGFPITLNGEKLNTIGAIWLESKDKVTPEQHRDFYNFINPGVYNDPTYTLHFHMDAPVAIHGLFYFPSSHMEKYGMGRMESGASLYSRKVLIKSKSKELLPEWLRFVRGVADSEDIPLNISRENMQDSRLIQKIGQVITRKIIKYLEDEAKTNPEKYMKWYDEFGNFLKEGVCTEYKMSNDIARLLRFESSATKPGEKISLDEYVARMQPEQKGIYFLSANTRAFAETSPYFESFKSKKIEVLFLYQNIDEFVMNSLQQYNKRKLISLEKADAGELQTEAEKKEGEKNSTVTAETADLIAYMNTVLADKVSSITVTTRLVNSPAAIFDHESAAVRRLMKFVDSQGTAAKGIPKQKLEINPNHPILKNILTVKSTNPDLSKLIVEQLFDNCLIAADMLDHPRSMLDRLNTILAKSAENATKSATIKEAEIAQ